MDGHMREVKREGSLRYVASDNEDAPDMFDMGTQTFCDDWTEETIRKSGNTLLSLHKFSIAFDRLTTLYTELRKAYALKSSKEPDPRDYDVRRRDRFSYAARYYYKNRGSWYRRDYSPDRSYSSGPRREKRQSSESASDSKHSYTRKYT
jgi:hypothetical protein